MVDEIKATGTNFSAGAIGRLKPYVRTVASVSEETTEVTDRVEISTLATLLAKYAEMPDVRSELVAKIRAEIQAGKYETPEKWDQAIENLMEDLET